MGITEKVTENTLKKILILAANPIGTAPLRLDKEVREIDNGLQRAQRRELFELRQKWAVRSLDVRRELLDFKPHFVHFCGHGEGEAGILFEGYDGQANFVNAEALAGFFKLFSSHVNCVLLNACYSEIQAKAISQYIDYVIGMNQAIGDEAAVEFAVAFYDALGAGESIEFGYELACNAIQMAGIPEYLKPVLIKRLSASPSLSQDIQLEDTKPIESIKKVSDFQSKSSRIAKHSTDIINPYDPWNPTIPPRFVGRVRELRELGQALEQGRSISLVGDWRIGKSSLLKTWGQQANDRGCLVVILSGEDSAAQSLQTFIQTIVRIPTLEERDCLNWAKTLTETQSIEQQKRAIYLANRWVEKLDEPDRAADILAYWAEQQDKMGLTPLLLIDEIGPCLKLFPSRFFERLRGMLGRIILVLVSHRDIDSIYTDMGHTSPFGNRLSIIRLGLLEPEIPNLIIQWGKNILSIEAMHAMRIWAGRHPFYLQLLGYHLVNAQEADESLGQALDNFYSDAVGRLRKLWDSLDEREQQTLWETLQGKAIKRRSLRIRGLVTEEDKPFGQVLREWLEHEIG